MAQNKQKIYIALDRYKQDSFKSVIFLRLTRVNFIKGFNRVMMFNTTFNNILAISWWSVLLVEYQVKTTDLPQTTLIML